MARIPPALVYKIDTAVVDGDEDEEIPTAKIVYVGESAAESHELLEAYDPEESGEREEAREFLRAELADGPRKAKDVIRARPPQLDPPLAFRQEPAVQGRGD